MAVTLIEVAKSFPNDAKRSAIIELFAETSPILQALEFTDIQGNAYAYNREETLPGISFRGVNEAYPESTGVINPETEPLRIVGGDLDVDMFFINTNGEGVRTQQEKMKVKALAHAWTRTFIKGDSLVDPRVMDGLQVRLTGSQKIAAGATANGTALSLAKLDEAIDAVVNPTHLIMNKTLRRLLSVAARNTAVGGNITYTQDEFGKPIASYNGLPILALEQDNDGNEILPFTEAATSGTATATSLYVVSIGDGMLQGIQNDDMSVRDLGELDEKPAKRTRVEWYAAITLLHPRAAARLWSIANAAVTA